MARVELRDQRDGAPMIVAREVVGDFRHHRVERLVRHPARELAARIALEAAAGRIGHARLRAHELERERVDVARVAAAVRDQDGVAGRRGVEIGARQEARRLAVVIQIAPHPAAGRRLRRARVERGDDLIDRGFVACHVPEGIETPRPRMSMRVVEPGEYACPAEIHATGVLARKREHVLARAHREKSPLGDCDRRGFGLRGIHRRDAAVVQDQVGLRALEANERQRRERLDEVAPVISHALLLLMMQS